MSRSILGIRASRWVVFSSQLTSCEATRLTSSATEGVISAMGPTSEHPRRSNQTTLAPGDALHDPVAVGGAYLVSPQFGRGDSSSTLGGTARSIEDLEVLQDGGELR